MKMLKVRYGGPGDMVRVGEFGEHYKGTEKDYPEAVAKELVETAKRQQFSIVKSGSAPGGPPKIKPETKTKGRPKKETKTEEAGSNDDEKAEDDGKVAVTMLQDHGIFKEGQSYRMAVHSAETLVAQGKAKSREL